MPKRILKNVTPKSLGKIPIKLIHKYLHFASGLVIIQSLHQKCYKKIVADKIVAPMKVSKNVINDIKSLLSMIKNYRIRTKTYTYYEDVRVL